MKASTLAIAHCISLALTACGDTDREIQEKKQREEWQTSRIESFCRTYDRMAQIEEYKSKEDRLDSCEEQRRKLRSDKSYQETMKKYGAALDYTCSFVKSETVGGFYFSECMKLFSELRK